MEIIENIKYKLHFFVVGIYGPAEVLYDKKCVVKISSVPAFVLSKRLVLPFCKGVPCMWHHNSTIDYRRDEYGRFSFKF